MTIVNVTITPDAAWLSSDSLVTEPGPSAPRARATTDYAAAAAEHGSRPVVPPARELDRIEKIRLFERARTATAGAGQLLPVLRWYEYLERTALAHFDEAVEAGSRRLPVIARSLPYPLNFMVLIIGWSPRMGRALGCAFASEDGFRPAILDHSHTMIPVPAGDDPEAERLHKLSAAAARGEDVAAFHLALARAQARGARRGLHSDLNVGGTLWLAEVTKEGVGSQAIAAL